MRANDYVDAEVVVAGLQRRLEIDDARSVTVLAVRHQLEDDCH